MDFTTIIDKEPPRYATIGFAGFRLVSPDNLSISLPKAIYEAVIVIRDERRKALLFYGSEPTLHDPHIALEVYPVTPFDSEYSSGELVSVNVLHRRHEIREYDVIELLVRDIGNDMEMLQ